MTTAPVKIAVCGHRKLVRPEQLAAGIQAACKKILEAYPEANFQVYSCLAEGADRLLADHLMTSLKAELIAVLPLPEEDYIQDFLAPESILAYRNLKQKAKEVIVLQQETDRSLAYRAANSLLLKNCGLLVALWDGKPSGGPGGTAETVEMARQKGLPVLWIHSAQGKDTGLLTEENMPLSFGQRPIPPQAAHSSKQVGKNTAINRKHVPISHFWHETRWILLGSAWLLGLILGYAGFAQYARQNILDWAASDIFYLTLQLIMIESGAVEGTSNWMLEITRFLLPMLTAYTALQALKVLFKEQMQWLRLWHLRGHVIVCGLGSKGSRLTAELLRSGYQVVVIEQQEAAIDALKNKKAIILKGDARDRTMLSRARLQRASHLICLLGEDQHNLQTAVQAYRFSLEHKRRKGRLTCVVHMESTELFNLVKNSEMAVHPSTSFQFEMFNPYARAAQLLIQEDQVWQEEPGSVRRPGHLLVIGMGRLGENLISQAAYTWFSYKKSGRLVVTVIDREATKKADRLLKKQPQIAEACQVVPLDSELGIAVLMNELIQKANAIQTVQRIYICLSDPVLSLQVCLALLGQPQLQQVPIRLRIDQDNALLELLKRTTLDDACLERIIPFDLYERTCSAQLVVGGLHERLAEGLYQNYLNGIGASNQEKPWKDLAESEKDANRQQANRIYSLFRSFAYGINPLHNWEAAEFCLAEREVEQMAKMEHDHWCQAKRADGWRFGPQRDDQKRLHPDLVDWDRLPEQEQQKNSYYIRHLPGLLARMGFQLDRIGQAKPKQQPMTEKNDGP